VVALAVVALVVAGLGALGSGALADDLDTVVLVDDAGGSLVAGSDVKYRGVVVGQVAAVRPAEQPGLVALDVTVEPGLGADVPADVQARILPASVFGTSFVDLVSRGGGARGLAAGQLIEQDRSTRTLELQSVLDGLDRVVGALGPARLATALDGLSTALDGNGERLGRTIEVLDRYLARLNPRMGLVRQNLRLLAGNLEAFTRYAPDLLDATDDALVAARSLVRREGDFEALLTSGSRTIGRGGEVLTANERALSDLVVRTAVAVDAVYDGRVELVQDGLLGVLALARNFDEAISSGRYLQIKGNLQLESEPGYGREGCVQYAGYRGRGC
jgi:phospholipid/cholesterol/gamma-HCH transport system substrate-binding protein